VVCENPLKNEKLTKIDEAGYFPRLSPFPSRRIAKIDFSIRVWSTYPIYSIVLYYILAPGAGHFLLHFTAGKHSTQKARG
jgi:hypothetical protein